MVVLTYKLRIFSNVFKYIGLVGMARATDKSVISVKLLEKAVITIW